MTDDRTTPDLAPVFGDVRGLRPAGGTSPEPPAIPPGCTARRVFPGDLEKTVAEHSGVGALDRVKLPDGREVMAGRITMREYFAAHGMWLKARRSVRIGDL